METQQAIGFYYVVKLKSFSKAAELTFRSQPALSLQIKKLEAEFGTELIERMGKHGVKPTLAGKKVYKYAKRIVEGQKALQEEILQIKLNQSGSISLAAPFAILQYFFADPALAFKRHYPELNLRIAHLNPQQCLDRVTSGEIDFGMVHCASIPANLREIHWKKGTYTVVVPKGHELTGKESITLEDIVAHPLILPEKNVKFSARQLLDQACSEAGVGYNVVMETPNIALNAEYVSRGFGIACMLSYEPFRESFEDKVDFISLESLFPSQNVSIIMRENMDLSEPKQTFLDFVLEH